MGHIGFRLPGRAATLEIMQRHLRIHGRVQGVGYREAMRRSADAFSVTGWVRNLPDGTVEALLSGSEASVEAVIDWARTGPRLARVSRVDVSDGGAPCEFNGFERR